MFGKQDWFRLSNSGKLVFPASAKGWCYLAIWGGVILAPFLLLFVLGLVFEAGIWIVAASIASLLDVRKIRHKLSEPDEKDLFYVGNEDQESLVKTQNFELHVRD
jgi:hypothetical protein